MLVCCTSCSIFQRLWRYQSWQQLWWKGGHSTSVPIWQAFLQYLLAWLSSCGTGKQKALAICTYVRTNMGHALVLLCYHHATLVLASTQGIVISRMCKHLCVHANLWHALWGLWWTVALASTQGADTVPISTLRTLAFLDQLPCHSLVICIRLRCV